LTFLLELPLARRQRHMYGFNLIFYPGTEITGNAVRDGYISPKLEEQQGGLTIQGVLNTPLSFNSSLDNPLWNIHFSSKEKEHYNALIALTPYFPKPVIVFLIKRRGLVRLISLALRLAIWVIVKTALREDNFVMNFFRKLR
ncbi:MAG: hypothetical protein WCK76_10980, partial [Elusimicrobiota bacterium]